MQKPGVYIEKGPQNFEIIQRSSEGYATLSLAGSWVKPADYKDGTAAVYIRVLTENDGQTVVPYTKCRMEGSRWFAELPHIPAGGPYKIETGLCVNGNIRLDWNIAGEMRHFVGIGDVYVIAGQSNSAGYGKGPVEDEPVIGIHALKYDGSWTIASHPLNDCTGAGALAYTEYNNHGNSPYLSFARCLKRELHVPIGLVPTAVGGSPISLWDPRQDGALYRRMQQITAQLTEGYCGVLWYQGCEDTNLPERAASYEENFTEMVSRWRKDAGNDALVFLTCQLNRCLEKSDAENDRSWGMVREAQRQAARKIPNCYIVPTSDIPLSDPIHNSAQGNLLLGERIARLALSEVYHRSPSYTSASLKRAFRRSADTIGLAFDGLMDVLEGFTDDMNKLGFRVLDKAGPVGISGCYFGTDEIYIKLEREPEGICTIGCGNTKEIMGAIPIDLRTYMPILCFSDVVVEELPADRKQ